MLSLYYASLLCFRLQKLKEKEEKLARRKRREEKRKMKQLEKIKLKEAEDMNRKIASEERLLLMAQRRLESIRLLSELFKRVEVGYIYIIFPIGLSHYL